VEDSQSSGEESGSLIRISLVRDATFLLERVKNSLLENKYLIQPTTQYALDKWEGDRQASSQ
jgi:hypothetical protein